MKELRLKLQNRTIEIKAFSQESVKGFEIFDPEFDQVWFQPEGSEELFFMCVSHTWITDDLQSEDIEIPDGYGTSTTKQCYRYAIEGNDLLSMSDLEEFANRNGWA